MTTLTPTEIQFATSIAKFIQGRNIDTNTTPMNDIIAAYLHVQEQITKDEDLVGSVADELETLI